MESMAGSNIPVTTGPEQTPAAPSGAVKEVVGRLVTFVIQLAEADADLVSQVELFYQEANGPVALSGETAEQLRAAGVPAVAASVPPGSTAVEVQIRFPKYATNYDVVPVAVV